MAKQVAKAKRASSTSGDKEILEAMKPIVDGIAAMFGENCEVLIHSLDTLDHSIVYIANGHVTGRSIGAPITDLGIALLQESTLNNKNVTDCYYSTTSDGKTLRSVTVLIRNASNKPIGMLCINFNLSAPLLSLIDISKNAQPKSAQNDKSENFEVNIENLIRTVLQNTIKNINSQKQIPNHEKNKNIVNDLIKKGIFDIRGAIDIVARELSVSRYTIYNYIRENKFAAKKNSG